MARACRFVSYEEVADGKGDCDERAEYAPLTKAECKLYKTDLVTYADQKKKNKKERSIIEDRR